MGGTPLDNLAILIMPSCTVAFRARSWRGTATAAAERTHRIPLWAGHRGLHRLMAPIPTGLTSPYAGSNQTVTTVALVLRSLALPSSFLQTTFRRLLHLQSPVPQHLRMVLRHTPHRQMLITYVVFRGGASGLPPTLSTATALCVVTRALAPTGASTLLSVALLTMS